MRKVMTESALSGPNGSGKTTLLKIFAGFLNPSKEIAKWKYVKIGYFDQENERLDENKTVLGSLQEIAEFIKVGFARDKKITAKELLDRFLFPETASFLCSHAFGRREEASFFASGSNVKSERSSAG